MLAPFNAYYVGSMQDEICDGCIGCAMTFQESFEKDSIDGNEK